MMGIHYFIPYLGASQFKNPFLYCIASLISQIWGFLLIDWEVPTSWGDKRAQSYRCLPDTKGGIMLYKINCWKQIFQLKSHSQILIKSGIGNLDLDTFAERIIDAFLVSLPLKRLKCCDVGKAARLLQNPVAAIPKWLEPIHLFFCCVKVYDLHQERSWWAPWSKHCSCVSNVPNKPLQWPTLASRPQVE